MVTAAVSSKTLVEARRLATVATMVADGLISNDDAHAAFEQTLSEVPAQHGMFYDRTAGERAAAAMDKIVKRVSDGQFNGNTVERDFTMALVRFLDELEAQQKRR